MRPPVHGGATLAAGCRAENYVAQEPVSHPQHIAAGYRRNITSGATFSVLCVTQHNTDFATGEHGDLLDVIARTCHLHAFRDVLEEARRFLSLPQPESHPAAPRLPPAPSGSPESARRLFASAKPILGTIAEAYLRGRGIAGVGDLGGFH